MTTGGQATPTEAPADESPTERFGGTGAGQQLRTGSLRRRVTLAVLAVLFVVLLAMVIVVQALFGVFTTRDVNAVLTTRTTAAVTAAPKAKSPLNFTRQLDKGGVRVSLVLADGQTFGSLGTTIPTDEPHKTVTLPDRGRLAGAQLTLAVDNTVVSVAQQRLRRLLLLTGLIALGVTAVVLILTVRFALSPLDAMTNLARSISRGGRGRRLWPTRTNTELGRTAAAFDDMLDALEGAEAQANKAEAAATLAAERTRRFVADAAHELRTPIAGVQAVAEAVLQQPPDADPEERQRLHLLLVRESRRASQLVDDLLDLARIDAGVELNRENIDLLVLAEAQADRIRLLEPGLTVRVDGPSLPVYADPARITQILANLLDNAKQATPPDGRISVRLGRSGQFAELIVADTGHGVPARDAERIFDRLVRLDRARDRRSDGSGLGLAIARGFARAHGGDLTCLPPPPGAPGAVFRLLLPTGDITVAPTVAFRPGAYQTAGAGFTTTQFRADQPPQLR
ncbi:MAG TPA: HAMP domain-containing sensor histidine kinase [Pseudonocardiaceae bacterium]|nr:HAMP domain-containing sensor histidine kinase [Pseudonocardiaceae bacterium]